MTVLTSLRRMTVNIGYLRLLPGKLKLVTITLAGIVMTLSFLAYFLSDYTKDREQHRHRFIGNEIRSMWRELFLMVSSTACFVLSTISLWKYCSSLEFYWNARNAVYDFLYHSIAAIFLGISGVLFIISGVMIYEINCTGENGCQLFELKLAAGGMSMLSAVIYGVAGSVVLTNRKDVEREGMMAEKIYSKPV